MTTDNRADEGLPTVSVVIPTRGRPELLRETLATIVAQDYAGVLEILVVHDREDAETRPWPTSAATGREVRSIVNDGTPRVGGARNCGLRHTDGEIVASCDDDDLWHPAKIRRQVERLLERPPAARRRRRHPAADGRSAATSTGRASPRRSPTSGCCRTASRSCTARR